MAESCAYLRYQAEKCRSHAAHIDDNRTKEALRELAAEYTARADVLESKDKQKASEWPLNIGTARADR
jgi:hypothetical protein